MLFGAEGDLPAVDDERPVVHDLAVVPDVPVPAVVCGEDADGREMVREVIVEDVVGRQVVLGNEEVGVPGREARFAEGLPVGLVSGPVPDAVVGQGPVLAGADSEEIPLGPFAGDHRRYDEMVYGDTEDLTFVIHEDLFPDHGDPHALDGEGIILAAVQIQEDDGLLCDHDAQCYER